MNRTVLSTCGNFRCHSVRLRRGDDLLLSIKQIAREKNITAGIVLSAVGCISEGRVRDASGVTIREVRSTVKSSASTALSAPSAAICTSLCPKKI